MTKFVCKFCGSENIQIKAWVGANDNEVHEWCEDDKCWCENCQDISEWEAKRD